MTPRQIDTFIERMGITPARFDEGVGIGGVVEQAAGKSAVKMDAMKGRYAGKGTATTAKDVLAKDIQRHAILKSVCMVRSAWKVKQAFTIAMRTFGANKLAAGVGGSVKCHRN